jgi:ectoine hydroxylase-related dioxygenase (phytanoyl-CoA dioxygenase family)
VHGVRLYHDQALFKEPGGGYTPWHQDQNFWPLDTDRTITLWMPLVDVPAEVGTMSFASGSHKVPALRGPVISDASQEAFAAAIEELGLPVATHGPLAAGDATFHAGWTVHSAPPNPTRSYDRS